MKKLISLLLILCAASQSDAQLASNKPLNSVYSDSAKQKLQHPKAKRTANAKLPSMAPMPKAVIAAQRNSGLPSSTAPQAQLQKKLPSNRRTVTPAIHPPKKAN